MRLLRVAVLSALLAIPTSALAATKTYCDGFKAGWEAAFRTRGNAPWAAPACPAPTGSNSYEGGYAAGMEAALRRMDKR